MQAAYSPTLKANQITCGSGQIIIVTGWTLRETVERQLSRSQYAAIGNLYSPTRGISVLIRNLLANPQARHLIVLNATKEDKNAGGCQCLLDFFQNGVRRGVSNTGKDTWIINSPIVGYIDIEIPEEHLYQLRRSLSVREASSIDSCVAQVLAINEAGAFLPAWSEPLAFPIAEQMPSTLPGRRYGHLVTGSTIADTWVKIIQRIKKTGTVRPNLHGGQWQELIDLTAVVTDEPEDFYFPEPNYLPIGRDFLDNYISQMLDDAPNTEGVKYTYGQRLRSWFGRDQIEQVIWKLVEDADSARAVMNLWDAKDHDSKNPPCLNHIWVRVVDGELSLTATFRSNDMFGAWPANAMGLRALQRYILQEYCQRVQVAEDWKVGYKVGANSPRILKMGPLVIVSQSAHIYDDCFESVDHVIDRYYDRICREQYDDPSGNFLIEIEDGELIVCYQTTPGSGEIVARYHGKNPLKLLRDICNANAAIVPTHAGYLGMELQKAFDCLKQGKPYQQDRHI